MQWENLTRSSSWAVQVWKKVGVQGPGEEFGFLYVCLDVQIYVFLKKVIIFLVCSLTVVKKFTHFMQFLKLCRRKFARNLYSLTYIATRIWPTCGFGSYTLLCMISEIGFYIFMTNIPFYAFEGPGIAMEVAWNNFAMSMQRSHYFVQIYFPWSHGKLHMLVPSLQLLNNGQGPNLGLSRYDKGPVLF